MPAGSNYKIKSKYEKTKINNLIFDIKKNIQVEMSNNDFFEEYKISKKDFLIYQKKAKDLKWLTNQELNSIYEYGSSIKDKTMILFHRFRFSFLPSIRIAPSLPAYILIEPTSICNMRCPMCFQTDKSFTKNNFMGKIDINFFKNLIDECHTEGIGALTMASRGEPTLHPQLKSMLDYCKGKFYELKINTNASRLNPDLAESILNSANHIVFSVDSHIKQEYESIRKGGNFEEVFENIKMFWDMRNSTKFKKNKIRVSISGVKVKDSQDENAFKYFWGKYSDDAYLNKAEERWNTYFNKTHPALKQSCVYPWERMYIWHDGVLNTCDVDYKSELSPGNIKELGSIRNAWEKLNWLRSMHLEGLRGSVLPCDRCGVSHEVIE